MFLARLGPLNDTNVRQPTRFMERRLDRGATHPRKRRDFVDGQVADAVTFDFAGNDAQNGSLTFCITASQTGWQHARTTEHAATVAGCPPIRRSLSLTRREPAAHARSEAHIDRFEMPKRRAGAGRTTPVDTAAQKIRIVIGYIACGVTTPQATCERI
jgi:hypothetical protein